MKSKIIEILFSWITTPILHLSIMQIFIALAELIITAYVVVYILAKLWHYWAEWKKGE